MRHPSTLHPSVVLPFFLAVLACGGEGPDASGDRTAAAAETASSGDVEVIGTFQADLDGETHTWYALAMDVAGERQATAMWWSEDGERSFMLSGMSERELPEEYLKALAEAEATMADVQLLSGSSLGVMMPIVTTDLSEGERSFEVGEGADVTYIPDVSRSEDMTSIYMMPSGSVTVRWSGAGDRDDADFDGTFEGTLVSGGGQPPIEVTNGRFEIRSAPYFVPNQE